MQPNLKNAQGFTGYIPTEGLFRQKGDFGSTLYRRSGNKLEQFDILSLLNDDEKRASGNAGAQAGVALQRLKAMGLDYNTLPEQNIGDVNTAAAREGLQVASRAGPEGGQDNYFHRGGDIQSLLQQRPTASTGATAYQFNTPQDIATAQTQLAEAQTRPTSQTIEEGIKNLPVAGATPLSNPSVVDFLNSTGKASDFASRAKLALSSGIQNYTGTAAQNAQLLSSLQGSSATPNTPSGVVTTENSRGESKIGIPSSTYSTNTADATVAGADASLKSINDYIKLLTPPESKGSDDLVAQIMGKQNELGGRGASQLEEEQARGIEQKKQVLQNYQTELSVKTAEYKALQAKYAALNANIEGKPITMNSIIGSQAQVNRAMQAEMNTKAAEIGMIQANVAGAQGNVDLAQSAADRAVDLKYSDAKDAIDIRLQQLQLLEGQLSKEEKVRNQAIEMYLKDQNTQIATRVANEKDKNNYNINAMQKYPSANIRLSDSYETTQRKILGSAEYKSEHPGGAELSVQPSTVQQVEIKPIGSTPTGDFSKGNLVNSITKLKLNEGQANSSSFAIRLIESNKKLNDIVGDGYDPTTIISGLGRVVSSDKSRAFRRELENFTRAQLRKESGATITEEELEGALRLYDPSGFGRDEKDIQATAVTRLQAIQSMIAQAGPAGSYLNAYLQSQGTGGTSIGTLSGDDVNEIKSIVSTNVPFNPSSFFKK